MTKNETITAYRIAAEAKLTKLETADKFAVIRAIGKLKPIAAAFDDFLKDIKDRLKPEGWDDIEAKAAKFADLSDEEKQAVNTAINGYNQQVSDCAAKELAEDCAPDFERLTQEAFGRLLESNPDWTVGQIMALQTAIA